MKQTALFLFVWALVALNVAGSVSADEILGKQPNEILPVEEAFRFGVIEEADSYQIFWQVQPGYFLYRDKFIVTVGADTQPLSLPEGQWHDDETFGRVEVLAGLVEVSIPSSSELVSIHYQGCAVQGFCYPPQKKLLNSPKIRKNPEKLF